MFEAIEVPVPVAAADVAVFAGDLRCLTADGEAGLVEGIAALEDLKSAAAAAQARLTVELDRAVRARQAAAGVPVEEQGRGVAAQVALARRESPVAGSRHLGLAKALVAEMPHTLSALAGGRLSEWRATLLVRETACLTREDRAAVDRELSADPATLAGCGDRAVADAARRAAYRLDPRSFLARSAKAEADRCVSLRPAPEAMTYLTGQLPVAQGVAAYAALVRAADRARAAGDPRSRGQVMADTLVALLTGQTRADQVPLEVEVIITDRALLAQDDEPAVLPGYGPVPAGTIRDLIARAPHTDQLRLRRLLTAPATGQLVALESTARAFPDGLRRFLRLRDLSCRTPWCEAPARHSDHITTAAAGGATTASNGQALCEACNYTKQLTGWSARQGPDSRPGHHQVETTTPTGHTYRSRAPALHTPLPAPAAAPQSPLERAFAQALRDFTAA